MKKEKHFNIIKRPLITEKSAVLSGDEGRVHVYEVAVKATKDEIKDAIENIFDVSVESVNTVIIRGKTKRVGKIFGKRSNWKKAYVTLKEGSTINYVEGV